MAASRWPEMPMKFPAGHIWPGTRKISRSRTGSISEATGISVPPRSTRTPFTVPRALAGAPRSRLTPHCRLGRSCTFSAPVATTGRRLAALTVSLLAAAAAGCGGSRPAGPAAAGGAGGPATIAPGAGSPAGQAAGRGTGSGGGGQGAAGLPGAGRLSWQRFCAARPDARLRAALRRPVPASLEGEVIPLGLSADGRTAYVSSWTPRFAGVAALRLATGHLRPIRSFPDPAADQADGASDGRWLVWAETHSLRSLDNFTVYAWDSATGRLRGLGHSLRGRHGAPWPSPWHAPAVSGNHAAWAQGYGPGGEVEVMLANLATGKASVVRRGHAQPPFFDGNLLVWPESDQPGAQTTLHALSLSTGRPAVLPAALRTVHGTAFVVTDGTRTAYLNPGLTALYFSPAQNQQAHVVLRLKVGVNFADLAIAPGSLAWTTTRATYLGSTRAGGYARVTPEYGDATGAAAGLLISDAPAGKSAHPILPLHVIRPVGLAWRSCRDQAG